MAVPNVQRPLARRHWRARSALFLAELDTIPRVSRRQDGLLRIYNFCEQS